MADKHIKVHIPLLVHGLMLVVSMHIIVYADVTDRLLYTSDTPHIDRAYSINAMHVQTTLSSVKQEDNYYVHIKCIY